MRWKGKSLRSQLELAFNGLCIFVLAVSMLSIYHTHRITSIKTFDQQVLLLQNKILELLRLDDQFFKYEVYKDNFYKKPATKFPLFEKREELRQNILHIWGDIHSEESTPYLKTTIDINSPKSLFAQYNQLTDTVISLLRTRGLQDYGLIGNMRVYAHRLEKDPGISMEKVLTLRRHEKDYLLRGKSTFKEQNEALIQSLQQEPLPSETKQDLENYEDYFGKVVAVDQMIGNVEHAGLKHLQDSTGVALYRTLNLMRENSLNHTERLITYGNALYFIAIALALLISISVSLYISRRLSSPLEKLTLSINQFICENLNNNEGTRVEVPKAKTENEITLLTQSFLNLIKKIKIQFEEIRAKSSTLEKQNVELRKVNQELDHFLYSTAHDLKAPLSSLKGLIYIALHDPDNTRVKEYLHKMDRSVLKQEKFIRELVDYSRNNRTTLSIAEVDIASLTDDIIEEYRYSQPFPIRIETDFDFTHPNFTDGRRLGIVLNNLLSNAFKYSDGQKKHSFIKISGYNTLNKTVVSIKDNGIGIPEEHLPKIFDMFHRATETSSGSGLGLFLVKETITKLKGKINVKSSEGQGTEFDIAFQNFYAHQPIETLIKSKSH